MLRDLTLMALAFVCAVPLGHVTYRIAFASRLSPQERELVREGRATSEFRSQRAAGLAGAIFVVVGTSASTPTAPAWVYFAAWGITMPLAVLTFARWSPGIRLYFFLAILPAAIMFSVFATP